MPLANVASDVAGWQGDGRQGHNTSPREGGREGEARARGACCVPGAILVDGGWGAAVEVFPPVGGRGAGQSR